jgi:D-lyxose ketol-isomerase
MKRSLINKEIKNAMEIASRFNFPLPPFAYWTPQEWEKADDRFDEICVNMLGWDVTDFGTGDFEKCGLVSFVFRNGNTLKNSDYKKDYAEKLLLVKDSQILPYHFHVSKTEDIINRGGGELEITLYNSTQEGEFSDADVIVSVDGERIQIKAGSTLTLKPGQSITLRPGQYHQWRGKPGTGTVILFEVSTTNDDHTDNRFHEERNRLPEIEEDEEKEFLISQDYEKNNR